MVVEILESLFMNILRINMIFCFFVDKKAAEIKKYGGGGKSL